jgi:hypothetical protein
MLEARLKLVPRHIAVAGVVAEVEEAAHPGALDAVDVVGPGRLAGSARATVVVDLPDRGPGHGLATAVSRRRFLMRSSKMLVLATALGSILSLPAARAEVHHAQGELAARRRPPQCSSSRG